MSDYLIAFNDEWVSDLSEEEYARASRDVKALRTEMEAAGVLVYLNGLDETAPVFSVDATSGTPMFTDGPFVETKEAIAGFLLFEAESLDAAIELAARIPAARLGGAIEVRPIVEY